MAGNFSVISPCRGYVASTAGGLLEVVELSDSAEPRVWNFSSSIRKHVLVHGLEARPKVSRPIVSQVEWEKVDGSAKSSKVGVVVENYGVLLVFVLGTEEPIIIQQSKDDGIERFEWVPPVKKEGGDLKEGGYSNSKQLVVFTKNCLQMKLYSLDCTHILLTVVKPLLNHILVRPHREGRIWSIIADTREYNVSPTIYHFYNEGSVSTLFHASRLPHYCLTTPQLEWSKSGKWFSIFSGNDALYGFGVRIFNLLGPIGSNPSNSTLKPIVDLSHLQGDLTGSSKLDIPASVYFGSWIAVSDLEYYVTASVIKATEVKFIFVSLGLLRTIKRSISLKSSISHWKQVKEGPASYRRISKPFQFLDSKLKNIYSLKNSLVLEYDTYLAFFQISAPGESLEISVESYVTLGSNFRKLVVYEEQGQLLILFKDHIATYDIATHQLEVVHSSPKLTVKDAYLTDGELIVKYDTLNNEETSIRNWEKVPKMTPDVTTEDKRSELARLLKRNRTNHEDLRLGSINSSHIEDITDTFNVRKKARNLV